MDDETLGNTVNVVTQFYTGWVQDGFSCTSSQHWNPDTQSCEPNVGTHTLFIATTDGGNTNPAPGTYEHPEGTHVTVNALVPEIGGYRFLNWTLDGAVRTENPIEVIMDTDHALTAYFELIPVPVTSPWLPALIIVALLAQAL